MYSAPNSAPYNFTSMFNMTDRRGKLPLDKPCPGTLLDKIQNTPEFSKFSYMVKLANFEGLLNSAQANFTLFIPSDTSLKNINDNIFINMDSTTAWYIVKTSIIKNRIPSEILEDSPAAYYYTTDTANRLFITNLNSITTINNNVTIIKKDVLSSNGIIHVVDNLIIPHII